MFNIFEQNLDNYRDYMETKFKADSLMNDLERDRKLLDLKHDDLLFDEDLVPKEVIKEGERIC